MPAKPYKHDDGDGAAYLKGVGLRLQWLRAEIGWTQVQIASVAGVDQSTWNKYEQGARLASVSHITRLAEAVGFSLDYVYRGKLGNLTRRDLELRLAARHPELVFVEEGNPSMTMAPVISNA